MDIKRILVPVDFSEDSLHALGAARDLARQFDSELLLLYVIAPIDLITVSEVFEDQRRAGDAALTRIGADLRAAGQRFRVMVEAGVPARVIVDTAKRSRADLIVLGTHGRTGLAHMLIGSVAEKVVRTASCPVLAVRRSVKKKRAPKRRAR
jgi:nucleotide-binding universal stress UspA family protein